jgi:hypothetical protein
MYRVTGFAKPGAGVNILSSSIVNEELLERKVVAPV